MSLRRDLFRLAKQQPQLREGLLPLLKQAAPPALQSLVKEVFGDQARIVLSRLPKALAAAAEDAGNYIAKQVDSIDKRTIEKAPENIVASLATIVINTAGIIRYPLKSMGRAMRREMGPAFPIVADRLEEMVRNRYFPKVWSWVIEEEAVTWPQALTKAERLTDEISDQLIDVGEGISWIVRDVEWSALDVPPNRIKVDARQITFPFRGTFDVQAQASDLPRRYLTRREREYHGW